MKVKVAEASGALLDYLVARCEGYDCQFDDEVSGPWLVPQEGYLHDERSLQGYDPSLKWSLGGPIIEREQITLTPSGERWYAELNGTLVNGPTPLIAAMRAYVAGTLGDWVEIPDECGGAS